MTTIYDLNPSQRAFRQEYGTQIDTIPGVLGLLEKLLDEAPQDILKDIHNNEVFEFLDERYQELMEKPTLVNGSRETYQERYEKIAEKIDYLIEDNYLSSAHLDVWRAKKDRIQIKNRIKQKKVAVSDIHLVSGYTARALESE